MQLWSLVPHGCFKWCAVPLNSCIINLFICAALESAGITADTDTFLPLKVFTKHTTTQRKVVFNKPLSGSSFNHFSIKWFKYRYPGFVANCINNHRFFFPPSHSVNDVIDYTKVLKQVLCFALT